MSFRTTNNSLKHQLFFYAKPPSRSKHIPLAGSRNLICSYRNSDGSGYPGNASAIGSCLQLKKQTNHGRKTRIR